MTVSLAGEYAAALISCGNITNFSGAEKLMQGGLVLSSSILKFRYNIRLDTIYS